tara:strand:- start:687 stop:917 length:231 start_codon:yes stop_codon:yes gene_type:complete
MKIARTFTIDYHLYQELRKKSNQSRFVERAIRKSLSGAGDFSLSDLHTLEILSALQYRDDCPEAIKILIEAHLTSS